MSRYLFAGASEAELDGQGRVMLPPPLLAHAGLARDIVVAGVRDRLEIWDLEAWRCRKRNPRGALRMLPNVSHSSSADVATRSRAGRRDGRAARAAPGDTVVDCTFGAGGHAAMLEPALRGSGVYIAVDRDPDAERLL